MTTTTTLIIDTARVCAQGWVEQSREHDARRWTNPVPQADLDFVEHERLGRSMTDEEAAEFSRAFIEEFNTCMQAKAERNGWAKYRLESRTPSTPWSPEGSGDIFDSEEEAGEAAASLETMNDDGESLEYRIVEA